MYNNGLSVSLVTENGNIITEFNKDGLTYVEGRKGSKYKIRVENRTASKIKAVMSVDGLNIISGKRATSNDSGYVLEAFEGCDFPGWRINDNQVREFFFTKSKNSYNSKTYNDTNNIGVIGVMAYKAYVPPVTYDWNHYKPFDSGRYYWGLNSVSVTASFSADTPANLAKGVQPNRTTFRGLVEPASVGTGMGKTIESKTTKVDLIWDIQPFATNLIYYKTRKELEAMGIVVAPIKSKPLPSAFGGYCQQV
jgi:hypothetical protein